MSEYSDRIRKEFGEGDAIRDANFTTPDEIERFDDIRYGADDEYNLLDVYRPKALAGKKLPVIMNIHGGAWVYGDKGVYQFYMMDLAKRGFAAVNFSYRLAPERKFPAQIEDICAVFRWIEDNVDRYGLDTGNIFAVGDSAGAHLLGLFAGLYSDPYCMKVLKEKYPSAEFSIHSRENSPGTLKAVALNCGKYDLAMGDEADTDTPVLLKDFMSEGGSPEEISIADVTRYVTPSYPQVFLMTCPGDFLKYQAPFMADVLLANSVPFIYRVYGSAKDPLHHVFHCNPSLESAKVCNDDECAFFKSLSHTP
ncbi:MAG: alpha/beta hydrolase [Lachnospiraceae bacterium]|nr:alpha/beta hydrolase [Lachnospiraceae bacterium]